ncbi:MAG: sugar phosphate isomerase/epimerase [Sphingomonadales bacterium]|nr:sugar phosphate isomerase/epimerase [Sphingomonadales bacterium]
MTPRLSLDCLTLTATPPPDVIRSAAAAGFDLVSLWAQPPAAYDELLMTPAHEAECKRLMQDSGVGLFSLEVCNLVSREANESYRPALELGARLGAKVVVAFHFHGAETAAAPEVLADLAEIAAEYGLGLNLEPVAMGQTRTLAQARDLIHASGADVGILFDTWHLIRSGCTVEDLKAIEPGLIRYVQVNDGAASIPEEAMIPESLEERLYPGEGAFPLIDLLRAAPRDVPWAIETPSLRRARAGVTPEAQAREGMAAMRQLLAAIGA